jgi:hypothetical protein
MSLVSSLINEFELLDFLLHQVISEGTIQSLAFSELIFRNKLHIGLYNPNYPTPKSGVFWDFWNGKSN